MKKIIIIFMFCFAVGYVDAQDAQGIAARPIHQVENISTLQTLGYTIGERVFIGVSPDGTNIYRAEYATNGKCKAKRIFCHQCAGCCSSGFADTDETGRILSVKVNGEAGQIYYYNGSNEDWFVKDGTTECGR